MSLLEVTDLYHTFGDVPLYEHASFELFRGDHTGVVGQNGAGKSTLIKVLTGELVPDAGQAKWQPGVRIGHLSQYAEADGDLTVLAYLHSAYADLYERERQLAALYEDYAALSGEEAAHSGNELLHRAAELQEQLEHSSFYTVDSSVNRMIHGLGLDAFGVDTPIGELSGGQRTKVILAKLLLEQADVLLLDEPTNFLDKEHIDWLSEYLSSFPGAFVVVSHDFDFLERVSTSILDIEFGTIRKYHGRYSDFLRQKKQLREDYIRQYNAQRKKIEQTEEYIRKNKAGVNSKMARGRQKQLDRLERLAPPNFTGKPNIYFMEAPLSAQSPLVVEELEVGYTGALLPPLSLTIPAGQKWVITGFNGIGKSTLLKTLTGQLPPVSGSYQFIDSVQVAYYEQDLRWEDDRMTPLQILAEAYPNLNEKQLRRRLALCGVDADNVTQPVSTLSGGEQSKVKLCRLLYVPANFLILDEPTNHLDAAAKEALREALIAFPGNVLLVSHEESFYRDWADRIFPIGTEGSAF